MRTKIRRIYALLLTVAILCTLLPTGIVRAEATQSSTELTKEDYAAADLVFEQIEAMEDAPAKKNATQAQKTEAAIQLVEASDSYVEGSLERSGAAFSWWTDSGIRCMYNPRINKLHENIEPENRIDEIVNEPKSTRGGTPSGKDVYLIGPYYGSDENFGAQYRIEAREVAQAIGDTDGYTLYSGNQATIDNVAKAVSNGAVVFFDSHGTTDYYNEYNEDDMITGANYSYLCLSSTAGMTTTDYDLGAAYTIDGGACVNGAVIANHMTKDSPSGIVWMAICLGMGTNTLCEPLRQKGVEVVYGYSESVTFGGDYLYEEVFWDNMKTGKTVAQSIAAMKSEWGNWDYSTQMFGSQGYSTIAEARADFIAFPVVVSDEDVHPGQRTASFYGADSLQTVQSTYTLGQVNPVTDPTDAKTILEEAYSLCPGEYLPYSATLTGKITEVYTPYDDYYKNVTVIMVVPGYETKPIKCYRLSGTGVDVIQVGDTITVTGDITNYEHSSGDTEVEFDWSCTLVSYSSGSTSGGDTSGDGGDTDVDTPQTPVIPSGQEATLSFTDEENRTEYSTERQIWQENGITVTNEKTENSGTVGDYVNPARFYAGSKLTVEAADMAKIVFNCSSASYATALYNSIPTASSIQITLSGAEVIVEFTALQDSFVIETLTKQVRVYSITVTAGKEPEPTAEICLKGVNVDFASSLSLNFNNTEEVLGQYEDLYVIFEVEGKEPIKVSQYSLSVDSEGKTRYNFSYEGLTIMDVAVQVNATIYGTFNGKQYKDATVRYYSLLRYATNAITKNTSDAKPCANLLKYAIAAEAYKKVPESENLASQLTEEQKTAMESYAYPDSDFNATPNKDASNAVGSQMKFSGQSVEMDSRITLIYKMHLVDNSLNLSKVTFKMTYTDANGKAQEETYTVQDTIVTSSTDLELHFAKFHATQLRFRARLTVYIDGVAHCYYENSVENYCYVTVKNEDDEAMKYLAKRISLYGDACAATYTNTNNPC